ncbi:hypothetical protein N566_09335 [Streptomycetaceae bacterium MP113-05]|nr:hypothetical protein N566_09335 [Streptomycetaceae bacterium MP113-05]
MSSPHPPARILVAGIGNIFLGDDGFGVETARRLADRPMPPGVEVQETGVRGVHLAYQLLDGYAGLVLIDAVPGDDPPGTLRVLQPEPGAEGGGPVAVVDGHRMTPDAVLGLLGTLAEGTGERGPEHVRVVGCVPGSVAEGMGLTGPVAAAVEDAVLLVCEVVGELAATVGSGPVDAAPLPPAAPPAASAAEPEPAPDRPGMSRTGQAPRPGRRVSEGGSRGGPLMSGRAAGGGAPADVHARRDPDA